MRKNDISIKTFENYRSKYLAKQKYMKSKGATMYVPMIETFDEFKMNYAAAAEQIKQQRLINESIKRGDLPESYRKKGTTNPVQLLIQRAQYKISARQAAAYSRGQKLRIYKELATQLNVSLKEIKSVIKDSKLSKNRLKKLGIKITNSIQNKIEKAIRKLKKFDKFDIRVKGIDEDSIHDFNEALKMQGLSSKERAHRIAVEFFGSPE